MASIFTYDPDPPRVSSPWATPPTSTPRDAPAGPSAVGQQSHAQSTEGFLQSSAVGDGSVPLLTKLEAEPQEGPTEYKLHLLLRPRRSFTSTTTGRHIPGSYRPRPEVTATSVPARRISDGLLASTPPPGPAASSLPSRQHRLEQLTTQLLWRLQQSSPYHASASNKLVLPQLPEASAPQLDASCKPTKLLPGLEESRGALYEIGVSDDGTFIGLTEDELDESLNNLRAMAASLGCCVEIMRRVPVGSCEWVDTVELNGKIHETPRTGTLWVVEAFVKPDLDLLKSRTKSRQGQLPPQQASDSSAGAHIAQTLAMRDVACPHPLQEQLRVSLTGAAHSGKSSLLGSLTTATLDNGRGKSRLSLLKHRHEIETGRTSSVAQELIGYQPMATNGLAGQAPTQVINYASDNVSVWTDIHGLAEKGRLVFLSDSPGEPRYRRTTVRGLVGWAPHWTLLCIPADNGEDSSGKSGSTPSFHDSLGGGATDVDLSQAHLQLCLDLELPLVIVITKLDIASKSGLRQTLSKVLSTLKTCGRKPSIISDAGTSYTEADLQCVSASDLGEVGRVTSTLTNDYLNTVPIILTSAVKGSGIPKLHALLCQLPIPPVFQTASSQATDALVSSTLFHVEDVYSGLLPPVAAPSAQSAGAGVIVSGHLRYGTLHIGDELAIGPYPIDIPSEELGHSDDASTPPAARSKNLPLPTSRSFPGAIRKSLGIASPQGRPGLGGAPASEWRRVRVVSLRNLRLPVITLHAGQVGTVGIEPVSLHPPTTPPAIVRIRKGMVLAPAGPPLPTTRRTFTARFKDDQANAMRGLSIGTPVVVYIASVRASAKIVAAGMDDEAGVDGYRSVAASSTGGEAEAEEDGSGFGFSFDGEEEAISDSQLWGKPNMNMLVTFKFIGSGEFIEVGTKVLVMPGGGIAGLEGYVGEVVEDAARYGGQEVD